MKTLPQHFTKRGFQYDIVCRRGDTAIYRQTKIGQNWEAFEVGIVQKNDTYEIGGKTIDAHESWPQREDWGKLAWTYFDLQSANRRLAMLTQKTEQNPFCKE